MKQSQKATREVEATHNFCPSSQSCHEVAHLWLNSAPGPAISILERQRLHKHMWSSLPHHSHHHPGLYIGANQSLLRNQQSFICVKEFRFVGFAFIRLPLLVLSRAQFGLLPIYIFVSWI